MLLLGVCVGAGSQEVMFNDPSEWMTHRQSTFRVKTQVDTAEVGGKQIGMTLYSVVNGRRQTLGRGQFEADDFTKEVELGELNKNVIGGHDYLSIEWDVRGGDKEGVCEPVGVVVLEKLPKHAPVVARDITTDGEPAKAAAALKDDEFHTVGGQSFVTGWDEEALWLVFKRSDSENTLELAFDGKNGKNAFVAYADRFVRYVPSVDSVHALHYTRSFKDDEIVYEEAAWHHETIISSEGEYMVVGLRWHDLGVIPQDNRTVGFGAFELGADEKETASLHEGSRRTVPGTWGNLRLEK